VEARHSWRANRGGLERRDDGDAKSFETRGGDAQLDSVNKLLRKSVEGMMTVPRHR
jgi:hypothetical protein